MGRLDIWDLGLCGYESSVSVQERLVTGRKVDAVPDTLLLVEHEDVYTLGRSGKREHVLGGEFGRVPVVQSSRGGDVTYHGPGQLVGYPIVKLAGAGRGVLEYVDKLERVLMDVLLEFGVESGTDRRHRGVWVGSEKIAAIGVRVSGGVTMHGFSLNVAPALELFGGIVPCGIRDKGVTSLAKLGVFVDMAAVKAAVVGCFCRVFGYADSEVGVRVVGRDSQSGLVVGLGQEGVSDG